MIYTTYFTHISRHVFFFIRRFVDKYTGTTMKYYNMICAYYIAVYTDLYLKNVFLFLFSIFYAEIISRERRDRCWTEGDRKTLYDRTTHTYTSYNNIISLLTQKNHLIICVKLTKMKFL